MQAVRLSTSGLSFSCVSLNERVKMLMPKKDRVAIYEYLFKEGVMVAKKDFFATKHPKVDVPNLHAIKALQSLKSKGYVREQFAWCHFYWYLTNEGIQYLRDYLHLPAEIVPATLKRQTRTEQPRAKPKAAGDAPPRPSGGSDRQDYRKGPGAGDKKSEVGAGSSNLEFRGGFGRGRGGFGGAPSGGQ